MSSVNCWTEVYPKDYGVKVYLKGRLGELHMPICIDKGAVYVIKPGCFIKNVTKQFAMYGLKLMDYYSKLGNHTYEIEYGPLETHLRKLMEEQIGDIKPYCTTGHEFRDDGYQHVRKFVPELVVMKSRWPWLFPNNVCVRDKLGYKKIPSLSEFDEYGLLKLSRNSSPSIVLKGTQFKDTKATWEALSGMLDGGQWALFVKRLANIPKYDDLLYVTTVFSKTPKLHTQADFGSVVTEFNNLLPYIEPRVLINRIRRHDIADRYWRDSMYMAYDCLARGVLVREVKDILKCNDGFRMHQNLIGLTNSTRGQGLSVITFDIDDLTYLNSTFGDYTFTVARNSDVLDEAGYRLWNCVASYAHKMNNHDCTIVIASSAKNNFEAAIEINGNKINQAKIKYNHPVTENQALWYATHEWCKHHKLKPSRCDMGEVPEQLREHNDEVYDVDIDFDDIPAENQAQREEEVM